ALEAALPPLLDRVDPRVVVVSGDLTHRGLPSQHDRAASLLRGLGRPLVVVPGNHDIPYTFPARFTRTFAEFEQRPVASASIGQVHRARLKTGEAVAIKVQYPDIEEIVRIDLRALKRIFRIISYFIPYKGMEGIYREIRDMILQELDFRGEADNIERIASLFTGRRDVGFPAIRRELSTSRILTLEWIDGVKVSDRVRLQ
ncbi:MAG: AarF/UbiB family protein, partial [Thermoplasmatota archaeon]